MSGEQSEEQGKKGILTFDENMKNFICWGNGEGLSYPRMLAVDIFLDGEDIGYIADDGKVTISGHVIEKEPSKIMSYSKTLTLEQWLEIGRMAEEFSEKCHKRELIYGPIIKRLEGLARKMFSEDEPFRHLEVASIGDQHILLGGGKGAWATLPPGIYTYESREVITDFGYRSVDEQKIRGVKNLEDELLRELSKVALSIETLAG